VDRGARSGFGSRAPGSAADRADAVALSCPGGLLALLLRRITRPLAALTRRLETFAVTRETDGQLEPTGPEDTRRLIAAHNAMEARIAALLDEKDVMLGAIGHDLKTPLAALRVRIESVEDDAERARMARTIEDITRTLDDILSLARVGPPDRPARADRPRPLDGGVVDEYEDMGEPVVLARFASLAAPVRATWLRRALRNLIGNAVRYGESAEVSIARGRDRRDPHRRRGPGIPEATSNGCSSRSRAARHRATARPAEPDWD
jgi:signal transduction histidine kinase